MDVIAIIVDNRWRPGIGDPTIVGWVISAGYLLCALLCIRAARLDRPFRHDPTHAGPRFWWTVAAAVFILGVNK